ncbi:hypothetical protein [Bifidobacterium miconisargentati]|uniref:hypothetical protein n=1 Tax=Bifidobacterium miconisargentati TaxID=2834437 RepID=UPI001BDBB4AF|nr:hypothetical protein [Bifidobacterium miconisargentati]MBW3091211.1 hypothetical protein [Bifidobacterium miconisargentati]
MNHQYGTGTTAKRDEVARAAVNQNLMARASRQLEALLASCDPQHECDADRGLGELGLKLIKQIRKGTGYYRFLSACGYMDKSKVERIDSALDAWDASRAAQLFSGKLPGSKRWARMRDGLDDLITEAAKLGTPETLYKDVLRDTPSSLLFLRRLVWRAHPQGDDRGRCISLGAYNDGQSIGSITVDLLANAPSCKLLQYMEDDRFITSTERLAIQAKGWGALHRDGTIH